MAKKVKCIECDNSMDWEIPSSKYFTPALINTLKNKIVCGHTMKVKKVDHCQYCKHYLHEGDYRKECREHYERDLKQILKEG